MTLPELQKLIRETYGAKDAGRGAEGTFMWFMQEVGDKNDEADRLKKIFGS